MDVLGASATKFVSLAISVEVVADRAQVAFPTDLCFTPLTTNEMVDLQGVEVGVVYRNDPLLSVLDEHLGDWIATHPPPLCGEYVKDGVQLIGVTADRGRRSRHLELFGVVVVVGIGFGDGGGGGGGGGGFAFWSCGLGGVLVFNTICFCGG